MLDVHLGIKDALPGQLCCTDDAIHTPHIPHPVQFNLHCACTVHLLPRGRLRQARKECIRGAHAVQVLPLLVAVITLAKPGIPWAHKRIFAAHTTVPVITLEINTPEQFVVSYRSVSAPNAMRFAASNGTLTLWAANDVLFETTTGADFATLQLFGSRFIYRPQNPTATPACSVVAKDELCDAVESEASAGRTPAQHEMYWAALVRLHQHPVSKAVLVMSRSLGQRGMDGLSAPQTRSLHIFASAVARFVPLTSEDLDTQGVRVVDVDGAEMPRPPDSTDLNLTGPDAFRTREPASGDPVMADREEFVGQASVPRGPSWRYKCRRRDDCYGMCGRDCQCWRWVCGNCCYHPGCADHDWWCNQCSWRRPYMCALCYSPTAAVAFDCETRRNCTDCRSVY